MPSEYYELGHELVYQTTDGRPVWNSKEFPKLLDITTDKGVVEDVPALSMHVTFVDEGVHDREPRAGNEATFTYAYIDSVWQEVEQDNKGVCRLKNIEQKQHTKGDTQTQYHFKSKRYKP